MLDQRALETLQVLRRLPPHTQLPALSDPDAPSLLTSVLALDDGTDPIAWLVRWKGDQTARLALRVLLADVRGMAIGARSARLAGHPLPPDVERFLGGLGRVSDDDWPFPWRHRPATADATTAVAALRWVQRQRGAAGGALPAAFSAWSDVLIPLLELPEDVDPLTWLRDEHGPASGRIALTAILAEAVPPSPFRPGPGSRTVRPRAILPSGGFWVVVTRLILGDDGFAYGARIFVSERRFRALGLGGAAPQWPGFHRVVDDLGYHYLVRWLRADWGRTPWFWTGRIEAALYPAVAPGARAITLTAPPLTLRGIPDRRPGIPGSPAFPTIGVPLVWRFRIPAGPRG
jgi:FAD/FMN-containing dehydrogenase